MLATRTETQQPEIPPHVLYDPELSFRAKALFALLLNTNISPEKAEAFATENKAQVKAALSELLQRGYMIAIGPDRDEVGVIQYYLHGERQ